jgi:hypothetical protein
MTILIDTSLTEWGFKMKSWSDLLAYWTDYVLSHHGTLFWQKEMIMWTYHFEKISTSFLIAIYVKSRNFSKKRNSEELLLVAPSAISKLRDWKTEVQSTLSFLECSKYISVDISQQNWSGIAARGIGEFNYFS